MFVITVMPKEPSLYESDTNGVYFRYLVDHQAHTKSDDANSRKHFNLFTTLFANSEAEANMVAAKLAQHNPGCEVAVLSPSTIFSTLVPEVVKKQVSEKGVLPF